MEVAGVVLNDVREPGSQDASVEMNQAELSRRCGPPVLGRVRWNARRIEPNVDWWRLAVGLSGKAR
jgi:hypothetical protein